MGPSLGEVMVECTFHDGRMSAGDFLALRVGSGWTGANTTMCESSEAMICHRPKARADEKVSVWCMSHRVSLQSRLDLLVETISSLTSALSRSTATAPMAPSRPPLPTLWKPSENGSVATESIEESSTIIPSPEGYT